MWLNDVSGRVAFQNKRLYLDFLKRILGISLDYGAKRERVR
jgi:hypothetical protein